jgi:hypothetical protein
MEKEEIFGYAGSAVLFLGIFAPFISVPVIGSMNYFQNGRGDGVFILILAVIAAILTATKRFWALFPTGSACFAVLTYTFLNIQAKLSEARSQVDHGLEGNPFRAIAELSVNLVQFQWGFAVLILGVFFLMAAAAIDDSHKHKKGS